MTSHRPHARAPACLEPEALAALAEARLPADERAQAMEHVLACAACHVALGELAALLGEPADSAAAAGEVPAAPRRRVPWAWAAAAALLLALGGVWWLSRRGPEGEPSAEERLLALAARSEVRLLSAAELAERPLAAERGGLTVLAPRGAVLDGRPEVTFTPVAGATRVRVTLRDEDGAVRAEGQPVDGRFAWPAGSAPLPAGARGVARVVVTTPTGDVDGSVAFHVLTEAERAAYEQALARVAAVAQAPERALLSAHAAAGRALWADAWRWLTEARLAGAGGPTLAPLRARVAHQLGLEPR